MENNVPAEVALLGDLKSVAEQVQLPLRRYSTMGPRGRGGGGGGGTRDFK